MRFRCRVLYIESGDVHRNRMNLQQLHISFFPKYRLRSRGHKDHGSQSIRFSSETFNLIDMKIAWYRDWNYEYQLSSKSLNWFQAKFKIKWSKTISWDDDVVPVDEMTMMAMVPMKKPVVEMVMLVPDVRRSHRHRCCRTTSIWASLFWFGWLQILLFISGAMARCFWLFSIGCSSSSRIPSFIRGFLAIFLRLM